MLEVIERSKDIVIKYHFSTEQVENNVITLKHISTGNQIADALTKQLPAIKFLQFRTEAGIEYWKEVQDKCFILK